ncbi:unnamed protein product [Lasius platythorax]|uniref:Uncharacterized protein n=1 Tax=Lasius platythorax TaxID=488582 RepID=A0AAV2NKF6_9HYME
MAYINLEIGSFVKLTQAKEEAYLIHSDPPGNRSAIAYKYLVFREYTSIDKTQLRIGEHISRVIEERSPGRDLPRVII